MIEKPLVIKDLFSHIRVVFICAVILYISAFVQFFGFNRFFIYGFGSTDLSSLFAMIPYMYSLIIPLFVLVLSNRDAENNFPFASIKIIVSKIVSVVILAFVITIPLVIIPVCVNAFGDVEAAQVFTGFTGIIFYSLLAASFCLFLDELISVKPLLLALSIVIMLSINSLYTVPLYVNCSDFFVSFFNTICFSYHLDSFVKGIIDTRDLFFYVLTSLCFITASYFVSEKKKGRNFSKKPLKTYSILIVLITVFAFLDNSRIYKKIDLTKDKQYSVSSYTKDILKTAEFPVKITYYRSKELLSAYPQVKDVFEFLKICARENKRISLKLLDAGKEENQTVLSMLGVAPQQIQNVNNNRTEFIKVYSAIVIEYMGKQEVLPLVLSTASLEFELDMRFNSLIKNKKTGVYILAGNEFTSDDYNYLELILKNSNIEPYPLAKQSLPYIENQLETSIPLILFGTSELTWEESSVIEKFILKGGQAVIATSQYRTGINTGWEISKNYDDSFIPVLNKWGVYFEDKIVNDLSNVRARFVSSDKNDLNDPSRQENPQYENVNYPQWVSLLPQKNIPNGITMFWASPIKENSGIIPLFKSSQMAWTVKEIKDSPDGLLYVTNPFYVEQHPIEDPLFTKEQSVLGIKIDHEISGYYNFMTNSNPEVIVISDQYFVLNLLLELSGGETGDFRNLDFLICSILNLSSQSDLAKLQNGGVRNTSLYKITDTNAYIIAVRKVAVFGFLVPIFILALCAAVLSSVRKKSYENYI